MTNSKNSYNSINEPDHTAVRVALWRAMHALYDAQPLVFNDLVGLELVSPPETWKGRPDMHREGTKGYRAAIVARARFLEDTLFEKLKEGLHQYVILGAGLDTFSQRHPKVLESLEVYEIDKPETQEWKRQRLLELGYGVPAHLHLVPVDFESEESWLKKLIQQGFNINEPALVASMGVAMYLSKETNAEALKEMATLAPGSVVVMSFLLRNDLVQPEDRASHEMVYEKARAAGTPILSLFCPDEIQKMALEGGFKRVLHISRKELIERYFLGRMDHLVPASGEEILVAMT